MKHIFNILNSPWAITPDKLTEIHKIYEAKINGTTDLSKVEAEMGRPLENSNSGLKVLDNSNIGIIEINGVIAKKANLFSQISGATSTEQAQTQFKEAIASDAIDTIVLMIDSPGGAVDGTAELASLIFENRDKKKIITFSDGLMASAGYWIGSAAHEIYISSDTVHIGSIGVIATHTDQSVKNETEGVKVTEITAGKYKGVMSSNAPLSETGKETIQTQVDYLYGVFLETVAKHRNVEISTVLSDMAEGRIFIGKQAVDNNLVDGIMPFSELIQSITNTNHSEVFMADSNEIELLAQVESQKAEIAQFKEQSRLNAFDKSCQDVLSPYHKDVEDKKLTPAVFEKIEAELKGQKDAYVEGANLAISHTLIREIVESTKIRTDAVEDSVEHTASAVQADDQLETEIYKVMNGSNLSWFEARDRVVQTNPKVIHAYKQHTIDAFEGRL